MDSTKQYWTSGDGARPILFNHQWSATDYRIYTEMVDKRVRSIASGNHHDGTKDAEGMWVCSSCGAESRDFELFEEAGAMEGCIDLYGKPEVKVSDKDMVLYAEIARARQKIDELRDAMTGVGEAANEASKIVGRVKWADRE